MQTRQTGKLRGQEGTLPREMKWDSEVAALMLEVSHACSLSMLTEPSTCLCKNSAFWSPFQRPHIYVWPYYLHLKQRVGVKVQGQAMGWEEREFFHFSIQAFSILEMLDEMMCLEAFPWIIDQDAAMTVSGQWTPSYFPPEASNDMITSYKLCLESEFTERHRKTFEYYVSQLSIARTNTWEDQLKKKKGLFRVIILEVLADAGTWSYAVGSVVRQNRERQPMGKQSCSPHAGRKWKGGRARARAHLVSYLQLDLRKGPQPSSPQASTHGRWGDIRDLHQSKHQ